MKTLYVTDLDGTLFTDDEKISLRSVRILNNLIDRGLLFTVATARSFVSAKKKIAELDLKIPAIFYNGTFIYDPVQSQYIVKHFLSGDSVEGILRINEKYDSEPLVHAINENGEAKIYYKGISNQAQKSYVENRLENGDRRFTLVDDFSVCKGKQIMAVVYIGDRAELSPLFQHFKKDFELTYHFSEDHYTKAYWLEVSHPYATKMRAVQFLKDYLEADRLICFGDNLNDLSMFEAADEAYAVANAIPEVKAAANGVIGGHNEDGVAEFLQKQVQEKAGLVK